MNELNKIVTEDSSLLNRPNELLDSLKDGLSIGYCLSPISSDNKEFIRKRRKKLECLKRINPEIPTKILRRALLDGVLGVTKEIERLHGDAISYMRIYKKPIYGLPRPSDRQDYIRLIGGSEHYRELSNFARTAYTHLKKLKREIKY